MTGGKTKSEGMQATAGAALAPVVATMRRLIATGATGGPDEGDLQTFYGMVRYHLGWVDASFAPAEAATGKRLRPLLVVRCAEACGASAAEAAPLAAAVELLHNFTLVHDDIQDESAYRHHRETIWHRWGTAAAINTGDALYALAHEALYELATTAPALPPARLLGLARDFDRMALRIVEGQHLDLSHEGRWGGGEARYLAMIGGKTAAIMAFATRAGATVAGVDDAAVALFERFGRDLGLAFQIRDDILGIWAAQEVTGKPTADDIRRRKQSLPLIALDERARPDDRAELRRLYAAEGRPDEAVVARVLALLDRYEIADYCQGRVEAYHHDAGGALDQLAVRGVLAESLRDFLAGLEGRAY